MPRCFNRNSLYASAVEISCRCAGATLRFVEALSEAASCDMRATARCSARAAALLLLAGALHAIQASRIPDGRFVERRALPAYAHQHGGALWSSSV